MTLAIQTDRRAPVRRRAGGVAATAVVRIEGEFNALAATDRFAFPARDQCFTGSAPCSGVTGAAGRGARTGNAATAGVGARAGNAATAGGSAGTSPGACTGSATCRYPAPTCSAIAGRAGLAVNRE